MVDRVMNFRTVVLCVGLAAATPALGQGAGGSAVERGQYLATAGDCIACHTVPGGKNFAGGRAFKLPFGTIYSRNITPDAKTGIGSWSDDNFVEALWHGVADDGEHLYPAFPYTSYTRLSRDDVLAIKAYLFSLPPVENTTPPDTLSFPYSQRWGMALWNMMYNPNRRFEPDPSKPASWNRGAYLVEALGHCGECHTPRGSTTQSLEDSKKFAGALAQGWMAYNITGDKSSGIGGWTDDALVSFLSTGHAEGHSSASGPMAEVIADSLSHLTQEDIRAIVAYLRSIPPIATVPAVAENPPARTAAEPPQSLGEQIFSGNCANCHDWNGLGAQSHYADLLGGRTVNDADATNLMAVVLGGSTEEIGGHKVFMPPFGKGRSDGELAAVVNFTSAYFGSGAAKVTAADIAKTRQSLP